MRDAIVLIIVFGSLPVAFLRPFYGLLVWFWIAYMNPHYLGWGMARRIGIGDFVAIATIAGCLVWKEPIRLVKSRETYLLLALYFTFIISTIFSQDASESYPKLEQLSKIYLFCFLSMSMVNSKERFRYLIWLITLSLGFYSLKNGILGPFRGSAFTYGPGGFLGDNNDFAMALDMSLPFSFYLAKVEENKRLKGLAYLIFATTPIAVVLTYSRTGFVGLCTAMLALAFKGKRKTLGICGLLLGGWLFVNFAPEAHKARMATIVDDDVMAESKGSRIRAWQEAIRVGMDNPLTGVGLRNFSSAQGLAAHNSYLQVFADSGAVALFVFVSVLGSAVFSMRKLRKSLRVEKSNDWAISYSHMIEVSLLTYMTAGSFVSRQDFDFMFHIIAICVSLKSIALEKEVASEHRVANVVSGFSRATTVKQAMVVK